MQTLGFSDAFLLLHSLDGMLLFGLGCRANVWYSANSQVLSILKDQNKKVIGGAEIEFGICSQLLLPDLVQCYLCALGGNSV